MIHTTALTIQKTLYEGNAKSITAEGEEGQFTILPHHLPFLTSIKPGTIKIVQQDDQVKYIPVEDRGIFELSKGKVTILLS